MIVSDDVRIKWLCELNTDDESPDELPSIALEHLESGTGRLSPDVDVPVLGPGGAGTASVRPGDVLFGKLRPYLAKSWLVGFDARASTELMCLRPVSGVEPRWLGYLMLSSRLIEWTVAGSEGSKMPRTSWEKLGDLRVQVPPLAEQRAIADYLDTETARIDALITKKRRMIELLEERFVGWAELVLFLPGPSTRLDRLTDPGRRIMYGIVLPGPDLDRGVPIVKGGNVRNHVIGGHVCKTSVDIESGYERSRLRAGDLVVIIRGAGAGRVAHVDRPSEGWNITQDVARVAPGPVCDESWLRLVLEARPTQEQLAIKVGGATITGINIWDLKRLPVPLLDVARQRAVAAEVLTRERRHELLIAKIATQLERLLEHRQALITAAVTGELDMTEVVS